MRPLSAASLNRHARTIEPMEFAFMLLLAFVAGAGLAVGLVIARQGNKPRPARPLNCGDCAFMVPRAKIYRRDTIEDARDGTIHYLCQKRWIEVTPVSPWCELGRSKSRVVVNGKTVPLVSSGARASDRS
jgi:hypothetical protein